MSRYRTCTLLYTAVGLLALSGASCPSFRPPLMLSQPSPPALPPRPTLDQVIQVINANSSQIKSFSTSGATLSGPGMPSLRTSVVFQRPRRLRLRAETALTGPELDLGSNDELFWIWVRRNEPQAMYYCRHDQYASSQARQVLPIDPGWLIEALGIVDFDPAVPHQGPFGVSADRLSVHTVRQTPDGPTTKVTVIDRVRGLVVEQYVYDGNGGLIASAVAHSHRRDPLTGLTLPEVIEISCPKAELTMRIDLGKPEINAPLYNPLELWTMPSYKGWPVVNLCDPRMQPSPPPSARPRMSSASLPAASGWRQSMSK